ncbi:MAG: biotin/lipoyl-containing protein [Planctomycetota bacterium]
MPKSLLPVLVEPVEGSEESYLVLAPGPALVMELVEPGTFLGPGSKLGVVEVLRTRYSLVLPEGARGTVLETFLAHQETSVEHRSRLLRLGRSLAPVSSEALGRDSAGATAESVEGLRITSPSHGIFYRRPDPDSPPYVEEGEVIEQGTVLGLVEVMKCFNQIRFEGPAYPARARILAVRSQDASEVELGQTLFVLEPV